MNFEVLYEDNHLLIVNKPNNLLVQPDSSSDVSLEELAKQYIKEKYQKPGEVFIGVPHRLDRPVSGAIVLARTSKALVRLNEMFQKKEVTKTYWAVVKNKPPKDADVLTHYIVRNQKLNKSFTHQNEVKDSKKAILSYEILASSDNYYLLKINLETGRHHQIRCQLAAIGCPIKGDLKYGFARSNADGGISLHARKFACIHPVKKEAIECIAPVPNDSLWKAFERIVG